MRWPLSFQYIIYVRESKRPNECISEPECIYKEVEYSEFASTDNSFTNFRRHEVNHDGYQNVRSVWHWTPNPRAQAVRLATWLVLCASCHGPVTVEATQISYITVNCAPRILANKKSKNQTKKHHKKAELASSSHKYGSFSENYFLFGVTASTPWLSSSEYAISQC